MNIEPLQPADQSLLTSKSAAAMLGVSVRTLESWRSKGIGPSPIRLGSKLVRYKVCELAKFIERGGISLADSGAFVEESL